MGLGKWSALNESLPAGRIFISYRRQETAWPAGRLYDVLVEHFPAEQVFKDVENIEPGEDFVERITAAVGSCDVLLVLIGPHWLTITDENSQRRLDNPEDYVRIEIEAALKRKIRVIPILVDEAPMPRANQLPASLAALVRRNAVEINPLTFDTNRLMATVHKTLAEEQARRHAEVEPRRHAEEAEQQARREAEERARQKAAEQSTLVLPSRPGVPAGLRGSSAGDRVNLRWDPPVGGPVDVVAWEVRRGGSRVSEVTEPSASDQPRGRGSYTYTVTAVGADGQHSAESNPWVRPRRRSRWLVPALAILAAVLAAGVFLWKVGPVDTGTEPPPAQAAPAAPAGLTGNVSGGKIALRWNGAPAGSAEVAHWRVLQDGKVVSEEVPGPETTVPNQGLHSYTVVAIGKDRQVSPESGSWRSPLAWQKLKTGEKSFSLAGVAGHKGEIWAVGGQDASGKRNEVLVFNPQTKQWRDGPKLPKAISHAPLVSTGDKLYLLGGAAIEDGITVPLATVYSLDTRKPGATWIKESELPDPRYGGAAAWDGKRLVFAGGAETYALYTPRPAAADIWELRSGEWPRIGELQPARDRLAAATDGKGRIWFVGGAELRPPEPRDAPPPRKIYDDVDVVRGKKVSDSEPIHTAIHAAAAVWTTDAGTCVLGGSTVLPNETAPPVAEVQCPEGTGPGWPDLPVVRQNAGAAVIGNTVYVIGSRACSPCRAGDGSEPVETVLTLRFR